MPSSDTSDNTGETTQSVINYGREVNVRSGQSYNIITAGQIDVNSLPSDLPELHAERSGYVFRVSAKRPMIPLVVTLNPKLMTEQDRVRKLNMVMRRARKR